MIAFNDILTFIGLPLSFFIFLSPWLKQESKKTREEILKRANTPNIRRDRRRRWRIQKCYKFHFIVFIIVILITLFTIIGIACIYIISQFNTTVDYGIVINNIYSYLQVNRAIFINPLIILTGIITPAIMLFNMIDIGLNIIYTNTEDKDEQYKQEQQEFVKKYNDSKAP